MLNSTKNCWVGSGRAAAGLRNRERRGCGARARVDEPGGVPTGEGSPGGNPPRLRGVGAKFEELLVITDDDAFWLDDDLPHVHRWREHGITEVGARTPVVGA